MSWSDGALLVSTVAASGAALFAFLTVKDTRHFHDQQEHERKLDGLLAVKDVVNMELVPDVRAWVKQHQYGKTRGLPYSI